MSYLFDSSPHDAASSLGVATMTPASEADVSPGITGGLGFLGVNTPDIIERGLKGITADVGAFAFDGLHAIAPNGEFGNFAGMASNAFRAYGRMNAPDPARDGVIAASLNGFAKVIPEAMVGTALGGVMGGAALVGLLETNRAYHDNEGTIDPNTRAKLALQSGIAAGAGVVLPMHKTGLSLLQNLTLGTGVNTAFGMLHRSATSITLENAGYADHAAQVQIFDRAGMALDATMGFLFGGFGHVMHGNPEAVARALEVRDAAMAATEQAAGRMRGPAETPDSPASIPANMAAEVNVAENLLRMERADATGEPFVEKPAPPEAEFLKREPNPAAKLAIDQALGEELDGADASAFVETPSETQAKARELGEALGLPEDQHENLYARSGKAAEEPLHDPRALGDMPTAADKTLYSDELPYDRGGKKESNDWVAAKFQSIMRDFWGGKLTSQNITPEHITKLIANGVNEVKAALTASGRNAFDWYSKAIETAMEVMGVVHPEIVNREAAMQVPLFAKEQNPEAAARLVMKTAMAITSQNLDVATNAEYAEREFAHFKKHGQFNPEADYGAKADSIKSNLRLANAFFKRFTLNDLEAFVLQEFTVRELNAVLKKLGAGKDSVAGRQDDVIHGASIFGPKIGQGFLQNLMGRFDPITIDLWARRTWGRWTGHSLPEPANGEQIARLVNSLKGFDGDVPEVLKGVRTVKRTRKGGNEFFDLSDSLKKRLGDGGDFIAQVYAAADQMFTRGQREYGLLKGFLLNKAEAEMLVGLSEENGPKIWKVLLKKAEAFNERAAKLKEADPKKKIGEIRKELAQKEGRTRKLENPELSAMKPEWNKASKIISDLQSPIDAPADMDRRVMGKVFNGIRESLAAEGIHATNADIQALLWYPEKDIWAKAKGETESKLKLSYDDEFIRIADERGLGDEARAVAERTRREQSSRGTEHDPAKPDRGAAEPSGGGAARAIQEQAGGERYSRASERVETQAEAARADLESTPEGKALVDSGVVELVDSVDDLPPRRDGMPHPSDVEGMFDGNKVYLVAENLKAGEVRSKVLHEVGVHYGMEKMLGTDLFERLTAEARARGEAGETGFKEALDHARSVDTPEGHLAEETLAYLVDKHPELGVVQKIFSAIKTFIWKAFGGKFVDLTPADLRYLAESSLRRVARVEGEPALTGFTRYHAQDAMDAQHEAASMYAVSQKNDEVRKLLAGGAGVERALKAVTDAADRKLTVGEARGLRDRLIRSAKYISSEVVSPEQRLELAAEMVAKNLETEAVERVGRALKNESAANRMQGDVVQMLRNGIPLFGRNGALHRLLGRHYDGNGKVESLESAAAAKRNASIGKLQPLIEHGSKWGVFQDTEKQAEVVREIFKPGSTRNAEARTMAQLWSDVSKDLLEQMQKAGRPVKELANWALPVKHSANKVLAAGREVWVEKVMGIIDRNRYWNPDGTPMTDEQIHGGLMLAWDSISSNGILGQTNSGMSKRARDIASRRAEWHRMIHFRDGDAWLEYAHQFNDGSVMDTMLGHVNYSAKQIALMEKFGPNARANFERLVQASEQDMARRGVPAEEIREQSANLLRFLDHLSGDAINPSGNNRIAQAFGLFRNTITAAQLGGSVISALGDEVMLRAGASLYGIAQGHLSKIEAILATSADARHDAMRMGAAVQDLAGETARFGEDIAGRATKMSKVVNLVLKVQGLHRLDAVRRGSITMALFERIAHLTEAHESLADLHQGDNRTLLGHGLTGEHWQMFRLAERADWHGLNIIDPESIMAIPDDKIAPLVNRRAASIEAATQEKIAKVEAMNALTPEQRALSVKRLNEAAEAEIEAIPDSLRKEAAQRLLSIGTMEEDVVVPQPGAYQNFKINDSARKGTLLGEISKTLLLFKGFALSHFTTQLQRTMGMQTTGGRIAYGASVTAGLAVMGAVAQVLADLAKGKNPRNYLNPMADHFVANWIGALLKGGALGLYGDLLLADETRHGHGIVTSLEGPGVGLVEDLYGLSIGAVHKAMKGEDVHWGANAIRVAKGLTPGQNLWYTRLLFDRMFVQSLQEWASPGYLRRIKENSERQFGQTYWAAPGGDISAPDFTQLAGK